MGTKITYLYKITNKINGKIYVGLTTRTERRQYEHLKKKHGSFSILRLAAEKYGPENFDFEILAIGSHEYISELETKAINTFDSINNGYNIRQGGHAVLGEFVKSRVDDKPVYVRGFWFPALRYAVKSLRIPYGSLQKQLKRGTAGDVEVKSEIRERSDDVAIYVDGFWFPAKRFAKRAFSCNIKYVRDKWVRCAKRGSALESLRKSEQMLGKNAGEKNGMFGRKNSNRSSKIRIHGIEYPSISEAVRQTSYTKSMIEKRLAKRVAGFEYVIPQEI